MHVVSRGDTLSAIALQYGLDEETLRRANPDIDPWRLQIGQELLIPSAGVGGEAALPHESRVVTHTVQQGETLLRIAAEYGVTLNDIYGLNPGVSPRFLQVGDVLHIELGPPTPTPTLTPLPTATPLPYPAPVSLWPVEGEEFRGPEAHILLQWTSVGILEDDEWYRVRLLREGEEMGSWKTKVSSWRVSCKLYPGPEDSPLLRWEVVVKRTNAGSNEEFISPPSTLRSFFWR